MDVCVSYPQLLFNQTWACATMCCGSLGVTCVLHLERVQGFELCIFSMNKHYSGGALVLPVFTKLVGTSSVRLCPLGMQHCCLISLLCTDMCCWHLRGLEEIVFLCLTDYKLVLVVIVF